MVTNHCRYLTKNVTLNYLVRQICSILIIGNKNKNYDLKFINKSLVMYDPILAIDYQAFIIINIKS